MEFSYSFVESRENMFILENDKMLEVEGKGQSFKSPFCIYYRKEPGNEVSNEAGGGFICPHLPS